MSDLERLRRGMMEGCKESAELLLRHATRHRDLDLALEIGDQVVKNSWDDLAEKVSEIGFLVGLQFLEDAFPSRENKAEREKASKVLKLSLFFPVEGPLCRDQT